MDGRVVGGSPKIKKTGLHLGATLLKNDGFSDGDAFQLTVSSPQKNR